MNVIPTFCAHRVMFSVTHNDVPGLRPVSRDHIVGRMRLSTEPIASVNVSFTGVKSGSEIHIYDATGVRLDGVESASDPQSFTLQRYATGNPLNTVRIFIASLGYENIDLTFTLPESDSSIPIQQRIDRNYRNP